MEIPTQEARVKAISEALEAAEAGGSPVRHELRWKDGTVTLTQVEIRLEHVLLNPRSHRIQAALDSHPKREVVEADPFSPESQAALTELLRGTSGFERIKRSLGEEGQIEPGVVTRAGVLVNANTRAVALRDLDGHDYIKVLVLPPNAGAAEIAEVELRLQMRPDLREDYTFANQLLFIRDCIAAGWSPARVADELRYTSRLSITKAQAEARVHKQIRMLAVIDEIRARSGKRIAYSAFDEAGVVFEELDTEYEKRKDTDPEGAIQMRDARVAAFLAGVPYRSIRFIGADFFSSYLQREIEDDDALDARLSQILEEQAESEGAATLLGGGAAKTDQRASQLADWLTTTAGRKEVEFRSENGDRIKEPRGDVVQLVQEAMRAAAQSAKEDRAIEDLVERPRKRLREARQKIQKAIEALGSARTDTKFGTELGRIDYERKKVAQALESLGAHLDKERTKESKRTKRSK